MKLVEFCCRWRSGKLKELKMEILFNGSADCFALNAVAPMSVDQHGAICGSGP
jgi:hypothetical protein